VWRSWLAHLHGVQGVVCSSQITPTKQKSLPRKREGFSVSGNPMEVRRNGEAICGIILPFAMGLISLLKPFSVSGHHNGDDLLLIPCLNAKHCRSFINDLMVPIS